MNKLTQLSLFLLGPTQIVLDNRPIFFRTNKVQALLCYLVVEAVSRPGVAFRREALMEFLWPDMRLKSAQDNLRQTLYQLRKAVPNTAVKDSPDPQSFILSDRLAIQINPAADYKLDVADFQSLVASEPSQTELEKAAALYRGDFLADFYLPDSNNFETWSASWRNELRGQALAALDKLTRSFTEQRNFDKAETYARRQLEIDNLRESAHRQLMTALSESGRRHEALQQYENCHRLFLDELGLPPAAETTGLYQQIRAGEPILPPAPPHPIPRATPSRPRHNNLPAQTTSFVGRQEELADVVRLLKEPECRLLTLLGPGGIGKTRLSLQAAAVLTQSTEEIFPYGVFLVPLAAVPTMEDLVPAIAEATGFSFSGPRKPRQQLLAYLKSKELLLVLDNMEHLAGGSALLADFLTAVPGLTFLVTSRALLNLYEEWRFELKGMAVPAEGDVSELENYSAVQLFMQRARQAGPTLPIEKELPFVGQICQLLDGLPLGIELAAGWTRTYTCRQIAAEIERNLQFLTTTFQNVPERHRSLQVAFDHSWRLMLAESQQIFARISVFRGGFDQDAAEFVTGASPALLAGLVDNSMLQSANGRFQMNELLRQFGAEKLASGDKSSVRQRHADFYASFLQQKERHRWTAEEPAILDEIGVELKNIRAGWQWVVSRLTRPNQADDAPKQINRYTLMLAYFYDQRNRFHEGVRLFQEAAKLITAARKTTGQPDFLAHTLATVQLAEAGLRYHLSQFSEAEALANDSLAIFRQSNSWQETAAALVLIGMTKNRLGMFDDASRHLQESLNLFQHIGERVAGAEALNGLGIVATSQERFDESRQLLEQSLTIYEETGYQRGIARALSNLGTINVRSGHHDRAMPLYEDALTAARTIDDVMVIAVVLSNMGSISRILGKYEDSVRFYQESLPIFQEMDERRWIAVNLNGLGETLLDMGQIESADQRLRQALEISTAIQSIPDILDSLAALGEISAVSDRLEQAAAVLTFVVKHPAIKPLARERAEQMLAQLKDTIPPVTWEATQARAENGVLEEFTAEYT